MKLFVKFMIAELLLLGVASPLPIIFAMVPSARSRSNLGMVIFEFPSMEIAKRWYESPAYRAVKQFRQGAAEFDLFLAEGGVVPAQARMPGIRPPG